MSSNEDYKNTQTCLQWKLLIFWVYICGQYLLMLIFWGWVFVIGQSPKIQWRCVYSSIMKNLDNNWKKSCFHVDGDTFLFSLLFRSITHLFFSFYFKNRMWIMIYLVIIYIIKSNKFPKIPLIFHKLKAHVNYSHFRFSIPYVWNKNWCDKQDVRKACNSKSRLPACIDSWRLLTKASFL